MEPEDSFHEHLNYPDEIVPMADMTKFMRNDGLPLLRRQMFEEVFGQQQNGAKHAENTRLQERARSNSSNWEVKLDRRSGANRSANAPPANPPRKNDPDETTR